MRAVAKIASQSADLEMAGACLGFMALPACGKASAPAFFSAMPFSPEVHQLIERIEESSGLPVHVAEEPGMRMRATVSPARRGSPAHWVRFKPGAANLDYLVASQLLFLQRSLSLPAEDRWDIGATPAEQDVGIRAMGLEVFSDDFARAMIGQIVTQARSYPVGIRVDTWLRENLPGLRSQQDSEIRSQLAENQRALAPETRGKFPKGIVEANTSMNAAFAIHWAGVWDEPRFTIPFIALGYKEPAEKLLAALSRFPEDESGDRRLVAHWADLVGLSGAFHFTPQIQA